MIRLSVVFRSAMLAVAVLVDKAHQPAAAAAELHLEWMQALGAGQRGVAAAVLVVILVVQGCHLGRPL